MESEDHEREGHERLAAELAHDADRLERENKRLDEEIDEVRQEWEAKRQDPAVPGAPPPPKSESGPPDEPESGPETESGSARPEAEED
jgi:septal ring factor EnvC (AmiA/AmiB activator)